jgi:ribonuclease HII
VHVKLKEPILIVVSKMLSYCHTDDQILECGIDEVGRGSLFGRLYTGAVILPLDKDDLFDHGASLKQIKDSKKLSKRRRDILYDYVKEIAIDWTTDFAEAGEIDELNVLHADMASMRRALAKLEFTPGRVIVDGDRWYPSDVDHADTDYICVPQADAKYIHVACASIIAKVEHDRWISEICAQNPIFDTNYGLLSNMGYGTAVHMKGLKEHGATAYHRRSFKPVRDVLQGGWLGS